MYENESTLNTSVVFGAADGAVYNGYHDRELLDPLAGGSATADFKVRGAAVAEVVPVQWTTGPANWHELASGQAPTGLNDVTLLGGVVTVSGAQQAYATTVSGGRLHFDTSSSLASNVAVNAGGMISGDGWVNANLSFGPNGNLGLSSTNALNVFGTANLAGGTLGFAPGFTPPLNQPFTALTALGGLQGTLAAAPGQVIGSGFTLKSIQYAANSVVVEFAIPGDFNGDGHVDAADYVVWRKTGGTVADYNVWRSNFGNAIGSGAGAGVNSAGAVPEPGLWVLAMIGAILAATSGRRNRISRHRRNLLAVSFGRMLHPRSVWRHLC
jgi:hypothetical protein